MVTLRALLFVKPIFRSINLPVPKELVLRCDGVGDCWALKQVEELAVRYDLALKDSIQSKSLFAAERNGFAPGKGLFEENVLKVVGDEPVFKLIAVVINALQDVLSPSLR